MQHGQLFGPKLSSQNLSEITYHNASKFRKMSNLLCLKESSSALKSVPNQDILVVVFCNLVVVLMTKKHFTPQIFWLWFRLQNEMQ